MTHRRARVAAAVAGVALVAGCGVEPQSEPEPLPPTVPVVLPPSVIQQPPPPTTRDPAAPPSTTTTTVPLPSSG